MAHPAVDDIRGLCRTAFEDLNESDIPMLYYITWNPKPRYYPHIPNGYNPQTQDYDQSWCTMLNTLKGIARCSSKFCILPEISENGKLHCHGWFLKDDKIKWLKSIYPMLHRHGMIRCTKVKEIRDGFDEYMQEDLDDTVQLFTDTKLMLFSHNTYKPLFKHMNKNKIFAWADENIEEEKKPFKKVDVTDYFNI